MRLKPKNFLQTLLPLPISLALALWPASNFLCSWPQPLFIITAPPQPLAVMFPPVQPRKLTLTSDCSLGLTCFITFCIFLKISLPLLTLKCTPVQPTTLACLLKGRRPRSVTLGGWWLRCQHSNCQPCGWDSVNNWRFESRSPLRNWG